MCFSICACVCVSVGVCVCELDALPCSSKPDRCDLFSLRSEESKANMSDKGTVSPKEKEATEKRGRGRPRKLPEVKSSDVSSGDFMGCECVLS